MLRALQKTEAWLVKFKDSIRAAGYRGFKLSLVPVSWG